MTFQHRHFVKLAEIIAGLPADIRGDVAAHFTSELRSTNPQFSAERFAAACRGEPCNGRDKPKSPLAQRMGQARIKIANLKDQTANEERALESMEVEATKTMTFEEWSAATGRGTDVEGT
jgi:hypothetical protein